MQIGVVGISHNEAPVDIREKASFTDMKKIEATDCLLDMGFEEVVILSTCNRTEIYYVVSEKMDRSGEIRQFYTRYFDSDLLGEYLFTETNGNAINHLYRVVCGLDSVVIGEDQILGQAKSAHEFAMQIGGSKKILNKLFRESVTFSKKIKNEYKISENPLSVSSIAVKHAVQKLGTLEGKCALVIGSGKMGQLVLKYLHEERVGKVFMTTRSDNMRLSDLSEDGECHDVEWVPYREKYDCLENMDVIFTATACPHAILKEEEFPEVERSLLIVDIAVPRDVEESIGYRNNVTLSGVDDLKEVSDKSIEKRKAMAVEIEERIRKEITSISQWIKQTKVDPIIKSFNTLCEEIHQDTVSVLAEKIAMTDREKAYLEKILGSSFKRIIRTPVEQLKTLTEEEEIESYKAVVNKLFEFEEVR